MRVLIRQVRRAGYADLGRVCVFSGLALAVFSAVAGCRSLPDNAVREAVAQKAESEPHVSSAALDDALRLPEGESAAAAARTWDLDQVLRLATRHSRALQDRRDGLAKSMLALLGTRRDFGIQLAGTVAYIFEDSDGGNTDLADASLRVERILPTGGSLAVSGTAAQNENRASGDTDFGRSLSVRVDQPLLAGAGYAESHEALVQAERTAAYALRNFALERQDSAIGVVESFYDLLIQKQVLVNTRRNVEQSAQLRKRSEAMFRVGRALALDAMRARQQELSAGNDLARAESEYDIARRRFLLSIGLPATETFVPAGRIPGAGLLPDNEGALIAAGLIQRLDLQTVRDRKADAQRRLDIARSQVRPDLSVFGEGTLENSGAEDAETDEQFTAGVSLELPLDRRDERDAVRRAELDLAEAERALAQKTDEVRLEIMDGMTQMRFLANSVSIEAENINIAERRAESALIRFRNGELLNRDVVEAENELLAARNAYVRLQARYEIQRIRLLRNTGLLDVAADGVLVELEVTE